MQEELPNSLEGLLAYMGQNDPEAMRRAQLFATLMNQQQAAASEEAAAKEALRLRREVARRKIRRLQREHAILARRNETLAAALGACPFCWGEDDGCRTCRGLGSPGSDAPDEAIFMELVAPVLKLLGLVQDEEPPARER